jgi:hypothetical protein
LGERWSRELRMKRWHRLVALSVALLATLGISGGARLYATLASCLHEHSGHVSSIWSYGGRLAVVGWNGVHRDHPDTKSYWSVEYCTTVPIDDNAALVRQTDAIFAAVERKAEEAQVRAIVLVRVNGTLVARHRCPHGYWLSPDGIQDEHAGKAAH